MNYQIIYENLTKKNNRNREEGYLESHHIIPQCCGGSDDSINLVLLTAREHYIAHLLLTKIYKGTQFESALLWAFNGMCNWQNKNHQRDYKYNSKLYESLKGKYKHTEETKSKISESNKLFYSNNIKEQKNLLSERMKKSWENGLLKGRCGEENSMYGKTHSKESKEKISKAGIGKKRTKEFCLKNSDNNKGSKNSMALVIEIYNSNDELMFISNGNFKNLCDENNLPYSSLYRSYQNKTKLFESKAAQAQAKNSGKIKYKGWYAIKI